MTREKCKEVLQALWRYKDCGYPENEIRESLDIAIKALEEESCEDAISREKAKEEAWSLCLETSYDNEKVVEMLDDLPSTTPTRKKGKWINKSHTSGCGIEFIASECTYCGKKTFFDCDQLVYNYCPNCGCQMNGE